MFFIRFMLGIIFVVHGSQKLFMMGYPGVVEFLGSVGIPLAQLAAMLVIATEFIGGILLILGLYTRWAALAIGIVMLVAILTVHLPKGFNVAAGGAEFAFMLLAAAIALTLSPNSKWSLDNKLFGLKV